MRAGEARGRIAALIVAGVLALAASLQVAQAQNQDAPPPESKNSEEPCHITVGATAPFSLHLICGPREILIEEKSNAPQRDAHESWVKNTLDGTWRFVEKTIHDPASLFAGAVAFFTLCLVRVTNKLAVAANTQTTILKNQEILDRAYVFGGCGDTFLLGERNTIAPVGAPPTVLIPLTYGNYGETPAWVDHVVICMCAPGALPNSPEYDSGRTVIISDPTPGDKVIRGTPESPLFIEVGQNGFMFYGRFFYRDILEFERHSSFAYWIRGDGTHSRLARNDVPSAEYLAWN